MAERELKKLNVIVCQNCNSIVHESTVRANYNFQSSIQELKNVKTRMKDSTVTFYCNRCSNEMGVVDQKSPGLQLLTKNVAVSVFDWKKLVRNDNVHLEMPLGSYSGLKIKRI